MTKLWTSVAVAAAVSLLASSAYAGIDFSDTSTRAIFIEAEDSDCTNSDTSAFHPNFRPADAGCNVLGPDGGALFNDPDNDFYAILSWNGGTSWKITVSDGVYGALIHATVGQSGALFTGMNQSFELDFDTNTGAITAPGTGGIFYEAGLSFGGGAVILTLDSAPVAADKAFYGNSDNILAPDPEPGVPLALSCVAADQIFSDSAAYTGPSGGAVTVLTAAPGSFFGLNAAGYVQAPNGQISDIVSSTASQVVVADPIAINNGDTITVIDGAGAFGPPSPTGDPTGGTDCTVGLISSPGLPAHRCCRPRGHGLHHAVHAGRHASDGRRSRHVPRVRGDRLAAQRDQRDRHGRRPDPGRPGQLHHGRSVDHGQLRHRPRRLRKRL